VTTQDVNSESADAPDFLPGLGGWGSFKGTASFRVVICAECGCTQFFANQAAREDLGTAS
jgi:hypothetical protein